MDPSLNPFGLSTPSLEFGETGFYLGEEICPD